MILSSFNASESKSTSVGVRLPVHFDIDSDLGSDSSLTILILTDMILSQYSG
jgi:hypothetical protein